MQKSHTIISILMQRSLSRLRNEFRQRVQEQQMQIQSRDVRDKLQKTLHGTHALQYEQKFDAEQQDDAANYDDITKLQEVDDEYTNFQEPKIIITTSRNPTSKLKQFAKELKYIFPQAVRINRGTRSLTELVMDVRTSGFTDLILLHENRGTPNGIIISHLPHGPTLYMNVTDITMRGDVNADETVLERAPQLIFEGIMSKVGKRIMRIIQHLFPVPSEEGDRSVAFINRQDSLIFRNYQFKRVGKEVLLKEQGPRFNLIPYRIQTGAVDSVAAETEWAFAAYTNTAFRKQIL